MKIALISLLLVLIIPYVFTFLGLIFFNHKSRKVRDFFRPYVSQASMSLCMKRCTTLDCAECNVKYCDARLDLSNYKYDK